MKPIQIQAKEDCKNSQWKNFDTHIGRVGFFTAIVMHVWTVITSDRGSVYYDDKGGQHSSGTIVINR